MGRELSGITLLWQFTDPLQKKAICSKTFIHISLSILSKISVFTKIRYTGTWLSNNFKLIHYKITFGTKKGWFLWGKRSRPSAVPAPLPCMAAGTAPPAPGPCGQNQPQQSPGGEAMTNTCQRRPAAPAGPTVRTGLYPRANSCCYIWQSLRLQGSFGPGSSSCSLLSVWNQELQEQNISACISASISVPTGKQKHSPIFQMIQFGNLKLNLFCFGRGMVWSKKTKRIT